MLDLADRLSDPEPGEPEQASLRRAISTAYYALFHLLVQEAAQCWNGSATARAALERKISHGTMKSTSVAVVSRNLRGWSAAAQNPPAGLQFVAKMFAQLQEARHSADYDNARIWTKLEVRQTIAKAPK